MQNAELMETEVITEGPKRFVREKLRMPDGEEIDWYYLDTPSSVMIVPITAGGDVVLIRQYRHNLKNTPLNFRPGQSCEGKVPKMPPSANYGRRPDLSWTGVFSDRSGRLLPLAF